jgi:chromosome partitioning protein
METIAFFNLKGGVGKTTSAANIAWHAANEGIPTLLWDLDPQGASTWLFRAKVTSEKGLKRYLTGKTTIGKRIKPTAYANLDIIPTQFSHRHIEHLLAKQSEQGLHHIIHQLVQPLSEKYALVILDCPPSFSLLSEQIFETADALFLPIIPSYLSLRTFEQTHEFFKKNKLKPKRLHGFFTMVDRRRTLHKTILSHPPSYLKNNLMTFIPYAAVIEQMGEHRAPLPVFDRHSEVSIAYAKLWLDIKATLKEFK